MSREDLMRNLGIARSQLKTLRVNLVGLSDAKLRIDAVLHVLDLVEAEMATWTPTPEGEADDGQLELGAES